ncbi:MAG: hypothetical protein RIC35_09525 [Marinoscillum sp.]
MVQTDKAIFKTFVFTPSKMGLWSNKIIDVAIIIGILLFIIASIYNPEVLLALILFALQKVLKVHFKTELKRRDYRSYGTIGVDLEIGEEFLIINGTKVKFSEMDSLIIYVDEYAGMNRWLIFHHHGANNEIQFSRNHLFTSLNYYIGSQGDFYYLSKLVEELKKSTNPRKHNLASARKQSSVSQLLTTTMRQLFFELHLEWSKVPALITK